MASQGEGSRQTRRWRDYSTASGRRPVRDFLRELPDHDYSEVLAALHEVREHGTRHARHLRGDLWEVRASGHDSVYRVIFAEEGRRGQVLLSLVAFKKKTQKTPERKLKQAQDRLDDWRIRG